MKKVVLAGGSGNLGKTLTHSFLTLGYQVVVLSRQNKHSTQEGVQFVKWDAQEIGDWVQHLEGVDVLINLCGESIATSFTESNKRVLRDSRIIPTLLLGKALQQITPTASLWINFSGISIFEDMEGLHDEDSAVVGTNFLACLSQEWEDAFASCEVKETKKVVLRVSPVLSPDNGMFAELYPLVRCGLGGTVGDGRQYISWIHEHDFVRLTQWIISLENPAPIYHACSPYPESNAAFMSKFRKAVGVKVGIPLPTLLAKVGAWAKGVDAGLLLASVSVTSCTAREEGFQYAFPKLEEALENLLKFVKK